MNTDYPSRFINSLVNEFQKFKVQDNRNTFETTSTTVLHGLSFQMLQNMLRPRRT